MTAPTRTQVETRWSRLGALASRIVRRGGVLAALLAVFVLGMCLAAGPAGKAPSATGSDGHDHGGAAATEWTCSMHPQVRSPEPGTCPICGMNLVRAESKHKGSSDGVALPADVLARRVTLSPRASALARIRTIAVRPRVTGGATERRLLGRLDYDETRVKTVTAWTAGRIDRLLVATTGQRVRPYQAIAYVYSPEIYAAQSDLIQAASQRQRLNAATELARKAAAAALESARQRLRLLGVPDGAIRAMERARSPRRNVAIHSPFGGTVIKRLVDEGNYVNAGTGLYRIADLSRLWVQLDAYESDLPYLSVGQRVDLTVEALPGKALQGTVTFIDPVVNARTRTIRVRVEVDNKARRLRPGMFAEAAVRGAKTKVNPGAPPAPLVIPDTAPLFTGQRSVVYVELDDQGTPTYEARVVELGPKAGNVYPVLSGLHTGERVVIRGAFVLDADLQLRGGTSMMTLEDDVIRRRHAPVTDVPAPLRQRLSEALRHYLAIHTALAGDSLPAATRAALALVDANANTTAAVPDRLHARWHELGMMIDAYAKRLGKAADFAAARRQFFGLSEQIKLVLERFGNPLAMPLRVAFCPMAMGNRGGEWIQTDAKLANPYFGSEMHSCGEFHTSVAAGAHLARTPAKPTRAAAKGHQH